MKEIRAFVQPFLVDRITHALLELEDFPGMSVSDVRGFGRGMKMGAKHTLDEELQEHTQKVRVEIFVKDEMAAAVAERLASAAHTGNRGDGKVFILPVVDAIRIRTGERGDAAIWSDKPDERE